MKKLFTIYFCLVCSVPLFAQFSMDGQLRPRTEFRNGFKNPILSGQEPAIFTEQRTRVTANFKSDKLGFKLSIQDIRIWGETGQINKSDQLLSTHEAYGDYYISSKSTLRVGRQEVNYDDQRFFGGLDWAMQGRALDAVRYLFADDKGNQFDLMASWNQTAYGDGVPEPAKLTGNDYRATSGGGSNPRIFNLPLPKAQLLTYYKKKWKSGDVGITLLNDTYTSTDTSSVTHSNFTCGITPNFAVGMIKFGGQFYYTGGAAGKTNPGSGYENIDLGGFMANAYLQHTGISFKPLLGIDYLTGDDESTPKVEGWSPKYGTNHKFYGFMDYFYVGNGHGGVDERSAGLIDLFLNTTFSISEKASLQGHVHYFSSPEGRTNITTNNTYKGYLGTELDLVLSLTLTKGLVLNAGYSQMFGISETLKQLKFGNPTQEISDFQCWGWVMLNFTPKFL